MDKTRTEAALSFTQPIRQIVMMLIVTALVAAGAWVAWPGVRSVFLANIWLNGFIFCVFVFGVLACFWQVLQLVQSVRWIEDYARRGAEPPGAPPRLLAPLAALMRGRGAQMQISSTASRSILESVDTRIDEARDITRYLVNLLIFLGLLGTFYGLATTVPAIVDTIRSLAPKDGESGMEVFSKLMGGLEAQLGGMGTAFSSSLLGLAGSLVVGLLELFASHGQNRFFRELEEWLSSITRIGYSSGEGEHGEQGELAAVLDQVVRQMEGLQGLYQQADVSRSLADEQLGTLATAIARLSDRIEATATAAERASTAQAALLARIADGQESVAAQLFKQHEDGGPDAESRMRLRSIDVQLLRILEELAAGRQESVADLRADMAVLTGAIRQIARQAAPKV